MSVILNSANPHKVVLLVLPESSMMCVASVLEPLRAANQVGGKLLYDWTLTSLSGETIEMTCGLPLAIEKKFDERQSGDLLVVIGGFNQDKHVLASSLSAIRKAASGFGVLAGVEAGSWVLARASLFNGYQATTHWEDFEAFSEAFPESEIVATLS